MMKWISREEAASFADFDSFRAAWDFFIEKYGKDVVLESVDYVGDEKCYFCALIVDWETYWEMNRLFEKGEPVIGMEFLNCRQPIQIFEGGNVHVVH